MKVDPKKLLEAGAHFGHQRRRWNPKMKPYIFGEENGVHIFDLIQTKEALEEVLKVLKQITKEGKRVIFVGTKKQAKEKIKQVGKATGQFWVSERWLGGTLTNIDQMMRTLKKLEEMKQKRTAGEYKSYTKKERLIIDRKIERIERFFGGLMGIEKLPDYLIVVDVKRESGAIKEARKTGVKTIAIVDTNCDPTGIDYVIPANDDATKAIDYMLELMSNALVGTTKTSKKS